MARKFNLQPWRNELREIQKKNFIVTTAGIFIGCMALCGGYYYFKNKFIEEQTEAISSYKQKINELNKAKKAVENAKELQKEVTKQITVIQDLQNQRSLTVKILNYIAANTPKTVFLNSISYKESAITLEGVAENEMGVSQFMTILQEFPNFTSINLIDMRQAETDKSDRYSVPERTGVKTFRLLINVDPSLNEETKVEER